MDFGDSHADRSDAAQFVPEGIGYIQVTASNGMVYHFSLPVYKEGEITTSLFLNELSKEVVIMTDSVARFQKLGRYASHWLLTGITGPHFKDQGGSGDSPNYLIDDSDEGYFIKLNYGKWSDEFNWRAPFYGYEFGAIQRSGPMYPNDFVEEYEPSASFSVGSTELYYLNSIETIDQKALFFKSVRQDGHSTFDNLAKVVPQLRLDRIVLMDKEDFNASWFSSSGIPTTSFGSAFDQSRVSTQGIWGMGHYSAHQSSIDNVTLSAVEFEYTNELAKRLYNNINNTFQIETIDLATIAGASYVGPWNNIGVQIDESGGSSVFYASSDEANSGRLALKTIRSNGYLNASLPLEYSFDYYLDKVYDPMIACTNSESNLANICLYDNDQWYYDHLRKDQWGYFKNIRTSLDDQYISACDDQFVHAWSLKSITSPLGAELTVEYESDDYVRISDEEIGAERISRAHLLSEIMTDLPNEESDITLSDNDFYRHEIRWQFRVL
jgi:hypothetical protein